MEHPEGVEPSLAGWKPAVQPPTLRMRMEPGVGIEPTTDRLQGERSTTMLTGHGGI